jgi:hypothetical protein
VGLHGGARSIARKGKGVAPKDNIRGMNALVKFIRKESISLEAYNSVPQQAATLTKQ